MTLVTLVKVSDKKRRFPTKEGMFIRAAYP